MGWNLSPAELLSKDRDEGLSLGCSVLPRQVWGNSCCPCASGSAFAVSQVLLTAGVSLTDADDDQ